MGKTERHTKNFIQVFVDSAAIIVQSHDMKMKMMVIMSLYTFWRPQLTKENREKGDELHHKLMMGKSRETDELLNIMYMDKNTIFLIHFHAGLNLMGNATLGSG